MNHLPYIDKVMQSGLLIGTAGISVLHKGMFFMFIIFSLSDIQAKGQPTLSPSVEMPAFAYDEISVRVLIDGYRIFYVSAIYGNNQMLFVNLEELFQTLNIPCIAGQAGNTLSGFIENESRKYTLDYAARQVKIGTKIIATQDRLIRVSGTIYMESALFAKVFGMTLTFNFRTVTILLKSDFELPVLKEFRLEKLRKNVSKIKGEIIADTVLKRNYHLLKFGTADWSAGSFQISNGPAYHHFSLGVGAELLYGEADVSINYYSQYKFDNRQLNYIWRWVDNDKTIIKQAQAGKIYNQTIAYINAPIIGAVIRNTPTTIRKASGFYAINDYTEPNWNVELYINNMMVDYTKADASGLYHFKVPIVYGYTTLKLKFFGPMGEERTVERTMNVPYSVMPAKEFEYGLTGGMVQDSSSSRFGRAEFNYGVNRFMTVGGGLEYLSSLYNSPYIPFANATMQPFNKLTINLEYAYGVKARGLMNFYLHKDILLEIDYAKFEKGQRATLFNAPEERKIKLSVPFHFKKLTGFSKLDLLQMVYDTYNYNQSNLMVSAYYQQFSANSSTLVNWIGHLSAYVISDLALSYRMRKGITIRPSAQFDVREGNLITSKIMVEKYIPRGNFSVSYERNARNGENYFNLNFKYDLPFARSNFSASHNNGQLMTAESIQGSLALGGDNGFVYTSNNSMAGKGGILLYPFLDLNRNGKFDVGEKMVKIKSVVTMGGKVIYSRKDSIVRITDLNAFTNYLVEFQDSYLENIAWQFKHKTYQVLIDPNQFKRVDVPVISVGEVSGMANLVQKNLLKGLRGIHVLLTGKNSKKIVAETLSETDGYIYYMGLEPGDYIATVDPAQLALLQMDCSPMQIPIHISQSIEGDVVGGLDFTLRAIKEQPSDTTIIIIQDQLEIASEATKETAGNIPIRDQKIVKKVYSSVIQAGAFINQRNAVNTEQKLIRILPDQLIKVKLENGFYKVQIIGLPGIKEARAILPSVIAMGYPEAFIVHEIKTRK